MNLRDILNPTPEAQADMKKLGIESPPPQGGIVPRMSRFQPVIQQESTVRRDKFTEAETAFLRALNDAQNKETP